MWTKELIAEAYEWFDLVTHGQRRGVEERFAGPDGAHGFFAEAHEWFDLIADPFLGWLVDDTM